MTRQYRAFMLRCWCLGAGDQRFEIAHIQSGESLRTATLDDALAWIGTRLGSGEAPGPPRAADDGPQSDAAPEDGRPTREELL